MKENLTKLKNMNWDKILFRDENDLNIFRNNFDQHEFVPYRKESSNSNLTSE